MTIKHIQKFKFVKELQKDGEVFVVGGFVRDLFLERESKDVDLLVRLIPFDKLETILKKFGKVTVTPVGDAFGIIKFIPDEDPSIDFDIALPRTERKMTCEEIEQSGRNAHTAFEVNSHHEISVEDDLKRRDFTINAIAMNVKDSAIIDPFDGLWDLTFKTITVTSENSFRDDPLRIFRALQFAARFEFDIDDDTWESLVDAVDSGLVKTISGERILEEMRKVFTKDGDSLGFLNDLISSGILEELFDVQGAITLAEPLRFSQFGDFMFFILQHVKDKHIAFKDILKGDTETMKHIEAIDMANEISDKSSLEIAFDINKHSKTVKHSVLLPVNIEFAMFKLRVGEFPMTLKDLAVNGNDLKKMGIKGKEIGTKLRELLLATFRGIENAKEALLKEL